MVTSQKALISLLISVLIFTIFAAFAFTNLFDLIEARLYNPSITSNVTRENEQNAAVIDKFLDETEKIFSDTLNSPSVKSSFMSSQSP